MWLTCKSKSMLTTPAGIFTRIRGMKNGLTLRYPYDKQNEYRIHINTTIYHDNIKLNWVSVSNWGGIRDGWQVHDLYFYLNHVSSLNLANLHMVLRANFSGPPFFLIPGSALKRGKWKLCCSGSSYLSLSFVWGDSSDEGSLALTSFFNIAPVTGMSLIPPIPDPIQTPWRTDNEKRMKQLQHNNYWCW